jgi:predicted DCC family thiol-disulfide oxidoreductase YuxK
MANSEYDYKEIILFDGECNLCNGFVNFVIDRDHKQRFAFSSLQSEKGMEIQKSAGILVEDMDSIILYHPEKHTFKDKSSAIVHILKHFKGIWKLSVATLIIPVYFRNLLYDYIAANRYRWFGKTACRIPTPALKKRFI